MPAATVSAVTDTAAPAAVSFEHRGQAWQIPTDLIGLQCAWDAAHAQVMALVADGTREQLNEARTRRAELTVDLYAHPWMRAQFTAGRRHQADLALKACARRAVPGQ